MFHINKSPSRKSGEIDNLGSHFYITMYWAQGLANQDADAELKAHFASLAKKLTANEVAIMKELNEVQSSAMDINGYCFADNPMAEKDMRPSGLFNEALGHL